MHEDRDPGVGHLERQGVVEVPGVLGVHREGEEPAKILSLRVHTLFENRHLGGLGQHVGIEPPLRQLVAQQSLEDVCEDALLSEDLEDAPSAPVGVRVEHQVSRSRSHSLSSQ